MDEGSNLDRLRASITDFNADTGGRLPTRRTCFVAGSTDTGKTTFGNQLVDARSERILEILKMRGIDHNGGVHELGVSKDEITVFSRLESIAGSRTVQQKASSALPTGRAVSLSDHNGDETL